MNSDPLLSKPQDKQKPNDSPGDSNQSKSNKHDWRDKWRNMTPANKFLVPFTGIIAICTLVYAIVAAYQLSALVESNRINRESLTSVQRAFVTFKEIKQERSLASPPAENRHEWRINAIFENSGVTPAVSAINYLSIDNLKSEPDESRFIPRDPRSPITSVGPKATQSLGAAIEPESFIFGRDLDDFRIDPIVSGNLFIWGWIGYRDIFEAPHLTEFCVNLAGVGLTRDHQTMSWILNECQNHNCIDEYCSEFKSIKEMIPKATQPN